jgi:membrane-associated phospholipid phosphatase
LFRALVLSNSLVLPLKELVHRKRPDQRDHRSFPSGHSANSFAIATVLTRHYGWRLGMQIFAFAATVPTSRIREGRHHLSDVVAGATLGTISGLAVSRSKPGAQEGVVWMPTHSRGAWQLRAQWSY